MGGTKYPIGRMVGALLCCVYVLYKSFHFNQIMTKDTIWVFVALNSLDKTIHVADSQEFSCN